MATQVAMAASVPQWGASRPYAPAWMAPATRLISFPPNGSRALSEYWLPAIARPSGLSTHPRRRACFGRGPSETVCRAAPSRLGREGMHEASERSPHGTKSPGLVTPADLVRRRRRFRAGAGNILPLSRTSRAPMLPQQREAPVATQGGFGLGAQQ